MVNAALRTSIVAATKKVPRFTRTAEKRVIVDKMSH